MHVALNISGGKDSVAMASVICEKYPDVPKSFVFADTGWEHPGTEEWCTKIAAHFGYPLNVVRNPNKTFLTMVGNRMKFPDNSNRQCTSDLKRGPIQTWIRRNIADPVVINCIGLRAEESPARAKKKRMVRNGTMTNSKRTVWDWLPILDWTEKDVWQYTQSRMLPTHPVYGHLRRFSCRVCIFMTDHDIKQVAIHDPEAIKIISELEQKINFTMKNGKSIIQIVENGNIQKTQS